MAVAWAASAAAWARSSIDRTWASSSAVRVRTSLRRWAMARSASDSATLARISAAADSLAASLLGVGLGDLRLLDHLGDALAADRVR
jgi:hypothetical protein